MTETTLITPPANIPEALQKKWSSAHAAAFKQAQVDHPNNESLQRQTARREANKLLRVPKPETHADAAELVKAFQKGTDDGWQILAHGTRTIGGKDHLSIVTADGQRHLYPVPTKGAKSAAGAGEAA
jgi:hypothetical protein